MVAHWLPLLLKPQEGLCRNRAQIRKIAGNSLGFSKWVRKRSSFIPSSRRHRAKQQTWVKGHMVGAPQQRSCPKSGWLSSLDATKNSVEAHLSRQVERVMVIKCTLWVLNGYVEEEFWNGVPWCQKVNFGNAHKQTRKSAPTPSFFVQLRVNRWTAVFYVTCQRAQKLHTSNVGRYRLPGDEAQEKPREAPHEQISPANSCRK